MEAKLTELLADPKLSGKAGLWKLGFRRGVEASSGVMSAELAGLREANRELVEALTALLAKHDDRDGLSDLWPKEAVQSRAALAKHGVK